MRFKRHKEQKTNSEQQLQMKRQLGAEKRLSPLPVIHEKPTTRRMVLARLAVIATIVLWATYMIETILRLIVEEQGTYRLILETVGYVFVVSLLTFSALMYLLARQGALRRFSEHTRVPRARLEKYFASKKPSITVLIPSYSEEVQVIRKTLLSAAIQEYPDSRLVLLLDDKPYPTDDEDIERLNQTRALAKEIEDDFIEPLAQAKSTFALVNRARISYGKKLDTVIATYIWTADWLDAWADKEVIEDHVDVFFADQVLRELANDIRLMATALTESKSDDGVVPDERLQQLSQRLVWIFTTQVDVFERKKYASLSHEANKAMNLNSYIGLMGGRYDEETTPDGPILVPTKRKSADHVIADSDYLLTLDADSILLRDYCLRLVYLLEQPDNQRVAVTQTPYSSFRGAGSRIERLAGATTDIQHILHQGMSHYGATFWVGANAVIRKQALDDIFESEWVGGFEIKRYIQDRTVIEDTESSIDLAFHDWTLINYPERLSYSATPPDFGSLIVQRRRWANGGLLILPKLWAQIRKRRARNEIIPRAEIMLRVNYMASIAWASFGLIFLLAYPYDSRLLSPFVLLAALPYFLAMASDLRYTGYRRMDVFRIYGFNLILLAVNLAGVLKSIQQALTGKKIPFARTPKVKDRTVSPVLYVLAPVAIISFSMFTLWRDVQAENWANAFFAGFNATVATWAAVSYIGIRNTILDIVEGIKSWLYVETHNSKNTTSDEDEAGLDWRAVLYHGHADERVPSIEEHAVHTAASSPKKAKAGAR